MSTIKKIFLHKDGHLRSNLQILIASCTFLFTSVIGQDIIARGIYSLVQNNTLSETIYDNYLLTGILPEVLVNFTAGFLILFFYK